MEFHNWLLFCSIAFVATITPGPAVLLATSHSAAYGWKHAVFAILGNISGLFAMSALSVLGLGAVILSSALVFEVVKFIGAGYLVYLGIRLWRNGLIPLQTARTQTNLPKNGKKAYFQGLTVALSNPKAIAFTTALFPQFVDHQDALLFQFSILVITFMVLSFSCLVGYALLMEHARDRLLHGMSRVISKLFGGAFIASGVVLASAARESS